MYLVMRTVEVDGNGAVISNNATADDRVLRGGLGTAGLVTTEAQLSDTLDAYGPSDTPATRNSVDITSLIMAGNDFSDVQNAWNTLTADVLGINGAYNYELPGGPPHIANSNVVVFSALAAVGVDARDIMFNGQRYVDSVGSSGTPGGDSTSATLLATDSGSAISAQGLKHDVSLLGRDGISDTFVNTSLNEKFFGEQSISGANGATDIVRYNGSSPDQGVNLTASVVGESLAKNLHLSSATTGEDDLFGIERLELGAGNNSLKVMPIGSTLGLGKVTFDLGATDANSNDTLDFSQYNGAVYLGSGANGATELFKDRKNAVTTNFSFADYTRLVLSANGNDQVNLTGSGASKLQQLDVGNGAKVAIDSNVVNLNIYLGSGNDTILHAAKGTVINANDTGKMTVGLSDDVIINGAKSTDVIATIDGYVLHGAIGSVNSESPWVTGADGIRYGLNFQGDLVIEDAIGDDTFVSNYEGGSSVPFSDQTAGIFISLGDLKAYRLIDLTLVNAGVVGSIFKFANALAATATGKPFFNESYDPLVFDLSGSGIQLTAESSVAPTFDINSNGFGVRTGWVQPGAGILVLDQNQNGTIDNGNELLNGPGAVGFDELATMDSNHDGKIDASDDVYSKLQIWQDVNGDAHVDAGELKTLAQAGIAVINLANTAQTGVQIAGNTVNSTGTFVRSDGSTAAIDDVSFTIDPFHTTYLGDTTVSSAAAGMPNLKGYGTLADLRVAMTLDRAA
jgi:hypothetical protein